LAPRRRAKFGSSVIFGPPVREEVATAQINDCS
jgi:hypothetical protein